MAEGYNPSLKRNIKTESKNLTDNEKLHRKNLDEESVIKRIFEGIKLYHRFQDSECNEIEKQIEQVILDADKGFFKPCTVDRARLRTKFFFGERYTYGDGFGHETLFPLGQVDPIPPWVTRLIIDPLETSGILPEGFINSVVINLYLPGGCIVSHIDPPQIFDRPIVSVSFFSESVLSFGCKFSYKPIRVSKAITAVRLLRGAVLSISEFAADGITHCVRPQDVKARRAAIILRRVLPDAPRLSSGYRIPRKRSYEECERYHRMHKRARYDRKYGN